jgi:hypothetical protein
MTFEVPQAIYVPVLRKVTEALEEALASQRADDGPPADPATVATETDASITSSRARREDLWVKPEMIRKHLQPRPERLRAFLTWLADRPATWVGTFEAYPDLGLDSPYQLGGGLSGFQRYVNNRQLPLPWAWKHDDQNRISFFMHPDVAAAIKAHL